MAESDGISGVAVGLTAAGGLLVWSAIRNVHPRDTLKEILKRPSGSAPISRPFGEVTSGVPVVEPTETNTLEPAGGSGATGRIEQVPGSAMGGALVAEARKQIGKPYRWATAGPNTFDCSGLVVYCLKGIGIAGVPRFTTYTFGSWASKNGGKRIGPNDFRAGDVILRAGHMGIASSATTLIHAPTTGQNVKEATIWDRGNWWGWRLSLSRGSAVDVQRKG